MKLHLELNIEYPDERTAAKVFTSLEPDNMEYVGSKIIENKLIFTISSNNAGTLKNSADDLLACVKIAEETLGFSDAVSDLDSDAFPE